MELRAGQYITFRVARQDFAMAADCVRGILPVRELEPVGSLGAVLRRYFSDHSSRWLRGFATLGGCGFPVIDLRAKLGLPYATQGRQPYIVAVEIKTAQGGKLVGFVADHVCDVVKARERDFRLGKLRLAGRPRQVLDPACLLSSSEQ